MKDFTHQYSLSKTLRFELKPVGETAERIEDFKNQGLKSIVEEDRQRAEDYKKMKRILDDYHKEFIEEVLNDDIFTANEMESAFEVYRKYMASKNDDKLKKEITEIFTDLRKKIAKAFENKSKEYCLYKGDFSKLINEKKTGKDKGPGKLWYWLKAKADAGVNEFGDGQTFEQAEEALAKFNNFSTYFTGFNQNRDNIYTDAEQQTAISYRVINENMTRYFDNCIRYSSIENKYPELVKQLEPLSGKFAPGNYKDYLSQTAIDIYNEAVGHKSDDINAKGINQFINEYRQRNSIKGRELPIMSVLYKQILSDINKDLIIDKFENAGELLDAVKTLHRELTDKKILLKIKQTLNEFLTEDNSEDIYIKSGTDLTAVSNAIWGEWSVIPKALEMYAENITDMNAKAREKWLKREAYHLKTVQEAIEAYLKDNEEFETRNISEYFTNFKSGENDLIQVVQSAYAKMESIFGIEDFHKDRRPVTESGEPGEGFRQVELVREYLDSLINVEHFIKPLHMFRSGKPIELEDCNSNFYDPLNEAYKELDVVFGIYNKVRNYVTQKPYSKDKFKINFQNSTLLDGWDVNKESANSSVLLLKNGKYYLGVMKQGASNILNYRPEPSDSKNKINAKKQLSEIALAGATDDYYEKMIYKLLPDPAKMLPKVFFSAKNIEFYNPSQEIIYIRENGLFKKDAGDKESLKKWIGFMKTSLLKHPEWGSYFNFEFEPAEDYQDISIFYKQVAEQGYSVTFDKIKTSYIEEKVASGELYLFEIYNKDFSPHSKGRPNLHTMYWKSLFEKENLQNLVTKLNGEAEVFFRQHSIKRNEKVVHRANRPIQNKNPLTEKKQSIFEYDLVKDRRFTKDKFFLHCPITLNFKEAGPGRFNDKVNKYIAGNPDIRIIGIDRGERHLLYYSLIDQSGRIVEQGTLNQITSTLNSGGREIPKTTDYRGLLDTKEKERDKARKSWSMIENIKELKSGYLSHIVHKLAKLMVKNNAVVVLEDLNFGFKRGRFKVEKQVYQKFEKALIEKLNYLVFKDARPAEPGHYLNAYQLTAPLESFKKLGKQSGFIYYVPAWNTSKIDPVTGFVNQFYIEKNSMQYLKNFFGKFDSIRFNPDKNYFEFGFDYKNFHNKAAKSKWTICTHGDKRSWYNRKQRKLEIHNVTENLASLLSGKGINFADGGSIKDKILSVDDASFFKSLAFNFKLTAQLRHTFEDNGEEIDCIISPVAAADGTFFCSETAKKLNMELPHDADANGAYNIARKGLMVLRQIRESGKPKPISNADWLDFAQQNED
ncbi:hypothetical protein SMSP2_01999 [Limihaloglobus sulfuriphilus]|uniref:Type V CRISPR-associated protein Cpf1 n=1 Tax=Limihaloglobus sulfuriphilus TaxID=1851148 RepID=A0A1Q2MH85_9BACT|nr:type V CRISPR-associated protein Cas12a/Cpf1 [Limihaloglobus sulfuriphilus]AQQ71622.1 hypothetical protein SMSP2_01999 [Limihaloglobus sulfuriphilus]